MTKMIVSECRLKLQPLLFDKMPTTYDILNIKEEKVTCNFFFEKQR